MKRNLFALKSLATIIVSLGAALASGKTQLYQQPASEPLKPETNSQPSKKAHPAQSARSWSNVVKGNPIILPAQPVARTLDTILPGTIERGIIQTSVQAFGNSKSPVHAKIADRNGRDVILIGLATLEPNSKRIAIEFNSAVLAGSNEVFELKAHALDSGGTLGLKGDFVSGEQKYFAAELLASAAAGFADASINRSSNVLGNQIEERSIDNSGKKALGSALSRTADRYSEKVRAAPEYSVLEGPTSIQVLILEQPKRKL